VPAAGDARALGLDETAAVGDDPLALDPPHPAVVTATSATAKAELRGTSLLTCP